MQRYAIAGWMVIASLMACSGCDPHSGAPPVSGSLEEATVKGTVRVDGKLVKNGTVGFEVANIRRPNEGMRQAPISKDGTYEIKTLVGENYVELNCREMLTRKMRQYSGERINLIVKSGENQVDLEMPERRPAPTQ